VLSLLKKFFNKYVGPGSTVYGILRPCRRCVYQNYHEPILIVSKDRGPRIILIPSEKKAFVRKGKCLGFKECGKCFRAIQENLNLPCKWEEF